METKPYLIFSQNGLFCGVEAIVVQEIFFLPELTPIAEAPADIVGVMNLRGEILAVMDLNLRFGYHTQEYSISNSVIVIEWQSLRLGLIVSQVHGVHNISEEQIKAQLSYAREGEKKAQHFVKGMAQVDAGIAMLINPENLIRYSQPVQNGVSLDGELVTRNEDLETDSSTNPEELNSHSSFNGKLKAQETQKLSEARLFCPNATPQEKAIFRERANNLKLENNSQDLLTNKMPVAVIALNGEYFGLNLEVVREFTDIRKVTPVPCTPPHIVGNMNLRGEILTLVDVRYALNMPLATEDCLVKAIVVQINDLVAGVAVDEVLDVMYLNPLEMTPVPTAVHSSNDEYLRGTAPYREKMMGILDLHKMLAKGVLIVDEEV